MQEHETKPRGRPKRTPLQIHPLEVLNPVCHPGRDVYKTIPWNNFFCNNFVGLANLIPPEDFLRKVAASVVYLFAINRPRNLLCDVTFLISYIKSSSQNIWFVKSFCNKFGRADIASLFEKVEGKSRREL